MAMKEPPYSAEAERAVIGSALVYGEAAVTATDALRGDEFMLPHHREAWEAIVAQVARGKPTDPVSIGVELKAAGMAGRFEPSWGEWAIACALEACIPQQVSHHAGIVREKAASRKLIEVCTEALILAYGDQPWEDQLRTVREGVANLENLTSSGTTVHVSEVVRMVADDIERQQRGEKIPRVLTGISTADRVIGGCEPGDLVLVAARPGIGKSAFVGNVAAYCGMHQVPTFFFSVEMMLKKLGRRWISGDANINSNKLKRAEVDLDEWKKILKSGERFEEALLWANDAIIRLDQIIGESRRWHARHVVPRFAKSGRADDKRALLVVDYAQRVKIGRAKGDTREQEVAKVPTELKSLAKQLGCVIFLVVMLGREVERRGGDPILADLRESGAFEAEADIVLFLTHDATAGDRVIVAKNREGETGVAQCRWEKEITTWHALGSAEDYDGPDTRPSNWQDGREP